MNRNKLLYASPSGDIVIISEYKHDKAIVTALSTKYWHLSHISSQILDGLYHPAASDYVLLSKNVKNYILCFTSTGELVIYISLIDRPAAFLNKNDREIFRYGLPKKCLYLSTGSIEVTNVLLYPTPDEFFVTLSNEN